MTTRTFIDQLNQSITVPGQNLIAEFFIAFSRFECALKASGFVNVSNEKVNANWDTFIGSICNTFEKGTSQELKNGVVYLLANPPRIQIIENNQLDWRERAFDPGMPEINRICLSIRDVRNNLFHGGKFNGKYQEDVSRNFILMKSSIIVLNEWLRLSDTVRENYLKPIS
jgi:hypothetical protein